ncbi:single-stranded-DNA-specific exonuclease RecJ [Legionella maceachernii]|uniref:single-stranded-DNA-specific exonuclease RecJ n=3 Tax=Legionella maceachernii TaxID=466 RepID=UPI000999C71E|nr:single-stranded-DNA-specific exonuclease RecJ [Legionella maceachernii]SJZ72668.1 exonuclease RecJ [Legionella maceachernii]SUP02446.1 Single-stranded-DNA-specific exonuclease recJ [Legionella maceachernii]
MRIKQRELPQSLPSFSNYPSVLQRIYALRGLKDECQLDKSLQALLPFNTLTDIDKACVRLEQALREQQRILIVGDFDADGATSTALAISGLRAMGAQYVEFLVPNRFEFGYGLTPAIIEVAKKWKPNLIITVDNGIASIEGVNAAGEAGIDVIITDHHLPGEQLPKACAIVNPNQPGDLFKSKSIAGVGVIFYVMLALRRHLSHVSWFSSQGMAEPNMAQLLDLVALGTVADVVALDQNNRILVNQGLARIRQGQCRPGIKALIEISGRNCARLRESDLGFAIAPRLNAAGRLDDMSLGIECLLCENYDKALMLAKSLDELNQERRLIEAEMKEQALLAIDKLTKKIENAHQLPVALCMMDPGWHQGVIGILAGRLKERYHRPVIAFAKVSEDELKGSARSVSVLNIRDVLAAVDRDYPGLIIKFGGHAMAAGLSIHPQALSDFQHAFIAEVAKHLDISQCEGELWTDGSLQLTELTLETATILQQAGPWGQQFPEPCFDNVFEILDQRLVGQHHLKLSLVHAEGGDPIDAIAFNVDLSQWPNYRARQAHIAYRLDINVYQGRTRLQLLVEALQVV